MPGRFRALLPHLGLAALVFLAGFLRAGALGLYEDDWYQTRFVGTPDLLGTLASFFDGNHPRPLGDALALLTHQAGWALAGLPGLYLMGALLSIVRSLLVFAILRRLVAPAPAFLGAAFFSVYPAYSAQYMLIHTSTTDWAVIFFLVAVWLLQRGARILPHVLVLLSLTIYETAGLLFVLVPWMVRPPSRENRSWLAGHLAGFGAAFAGFLAFRLLVVSGRLSNVPELSPLGLATRAAHASAAGTGASLEAWVDKAVGALPLVPGHPGPLVLIVTVLVVPVLVAGNRAPATARDPRRLLVLGCLALLVAYAPYVTRDRFPPVTELGRRTSEHCGAAFAGAVIAAGALGWPGRRPLMLVATGFLALFALFRVGVQDGMVRTWERQQTLWRGIAAAAPDRTAGTVVVVQGDAVADVSPHAHVTSWTLPYTHGRLFAGEEHPVVVSRHQLGAHSRPGDAGPVLRPPPWRRPVPLQRVILFDSSDDGEIRRSTDAFTVNGIRIEPVAAGAPRKWDPGALHETVMTSTGPP